MDLALGRDLVQLHVLPRGLHQLRKPAGEVLVEGEDDVAVQVPPAVDLFAAAPRCSDAARRLQHHAICAQHLLREVARFAAGALAADVVEERLPVLVGTIAGEETVEAQAALLVVEDVGVARLLQGILLQIHGDEGAGGSVLFEFGSAHVVESQRYAQALLAERASDRAALNQVQHFRLPWCFTFGSA